MWGWGKNGLIFVGGQGWVSIFFPTIKETPTHNRNFEKLQSLVQRFTLANQNFTNLTDSQAHRDIITFFSASTCNFFRLSGCYGKAVELVYSQMGSHLMSSDLLFISNRAQYKLMKLMAGVLFE